MTPCLLLEPRAVPETSAGFGGSGGSGDFGRFQRLQAVPESSECSRGFRRSRSRPKPAGSLKSCADGWVLGVLRKLDCGEGFDTVI